MDVNIKETNHTNLTHRKANINDLDQIVELPQNDNLASCREDKLALNKY